MLEFTIEGPPVSHQTKNRAYLRAWMDAVRKQARKRWRGAPLVGVVKLTLMNFHAARKPALDDDNMAKPIRDAMNGLVYVDDRQICHAEHLQRCIDAAFPVRGASMVILEAFHRGKEFVYVRVEKAAKHIRLPK